MATAASGLVSVIPQPWTMVIPKRFLKASMRARGTAEPPAVTDRTEDRSTSRSLATRSRSFQMVGTPQARVGLQVGDDPGQRLALEVLLGHDQVGPGHPRTRRACPRRWRGTSAR